MAVRAWHEWMPVRDAGTSEFFHALEVALRKRGEVGEVFDLAEIGLPAGVAFIHGHRFAFGITQHGSGVLFELRHTDGDIRIQCFHK